jgi:serine phosphatase RsbU (regulator of sigma subunit)
MTTPQQPTNATDDGLIAAAGVFGRRRSYPAGQVLATQGHVEHRFYVIEAGRMSVTRVDEEGQSHLLDELGPATYFGEMGVLDDSPRFATVRALTDVTVLEIDGACFESLVQSHPDLVMSIVQRVLKSFRQLDSRTIDSLRRKNDLLEKAYYELQAAQAQIIEKEKLEREMELAAEMQRRLLPGTLPQVDGLEFAAYLAPARAVGGDLYDIRLIDDDHVAVLLADVADKGLKAALFMAVARTLFYQQSSLTLSPSAVALGVHRGLMAIGGADDGSYSDVFVTAFYGVLNIHTGEMTYVRAAQDRPLLLRAGHEPLPLSGDGRFLGMLEELELEEHSVQLGPGDVLLMMSDGIPDAHNPAGETYGQDRLVALLSRTGPIGAENVLEAVLEDIHAWSDGTPLFDDLTLMALSLQRGEETTR